MDEPKLKNIMSKARASMACQCCRRRKVRCDVVRTGGPCTNCSLDGVVCLVNMSSRKSKQLRDLGKIANHLSATDYGKMNRSPRHGLAIPCYGQRQGKSDQSISSPGPASNEINSVSGQQRHQACTPHGCNNKRGNSSAPLLDWHLDSSKRFCRPVLETCPRYLHSAGSSCRSELPIALPKFISPVPARLALEDLEYLSKKKAFVVPNAELRDELLRCFVQYVYPYLPLLRLEEFLTTVHCDGGSGTMSLLLFQAVMLSATPFVKIGCLTALGFADRSAARAVFYQKVKSLCDLDYESDRIPLLQALILMTYYHENPDEPKEVRYWLGAAVSLARTMILNANLSKEGIDLKEKKLWKRIWWCCCMRDKLAAIALREPPRISESEFDIPMLDVSDFDTDALPSSLSGMLRGCPSALDGSVRRTLAQLCLQYTRLCDCVGGIFSAVYLISVQSPLEISNKSLDAWKKILFYDKALTEWYKSAIGGNFYLSAKSEEYKSTSDDDVLRVHRAVLAGLFFTAVNFLHRPLLSGMVVFSTSNAEWRKICFGKIMDATQRTTDMYEDLRCRRLIQCLPSTGVTCLLPAILSHLAILKSSNQSGSLATVTVQKLQVLMEVLRQLRSMYGSAVRASVYISNALHSSGLQLEPKPIEVNHKVELHLCEQPGPENGRPTSPVNQTGNMSLSQTDGDEHHIPRPIIQDIDTDIVQPPSPHEISETNSTKSPEVETNCKSHQLRGGNGFLPTPTSKELENDGILLSDIDLILDNEAPFDDFVDFDGRSQDDTVASVNLNWFNEWET